MKAITKDYLADIIFRLINKTIETHRASRNNYLLHEHFPVATDAEILDFIQSIPYFDIGLKNFIVGNLTEETIIVSQTWETEFVKRSQAWAESFEWLHGDDRSLESTRLNNTNTAFLTLPY
jgi:hypothetical protein